MHLLKSDVNCILQNRKGKYKIKKYAYYNYKPINTYLLLSALCVRLYLNKRKGTAICCRVIIMFCPNCGAQLPDGSQFCANCGAQLAAENAYGAPAEYPAYADAQTQQAPAQYYQESAQYYQQPAQYQEAPQYDAASYDQYPQDYSNFAQANFDASPAPAPKKKKGLVAILISVVALVLVGVLLFFTVIKPNFTPLGKLKKAEMANLTSLTDDISEVYGALLSDKTTEGYGEVQMKLNLGAEVLQMLSSLLSQEGINMPLDWLNNISFDSAVNFKDNAGQVKLDLSLDDQTLVDLDIVADIEGKELYVGVPALSDKYLCVPMDPQALSDMTSSSDDYYDDYYDSDYSSGSSASISGLMSILTDPELKKALPSEDELNKLLDKYIELVFDSLKDVSKGKETLEVNGISQSLTVLKVNISTKTVVDVAENILKEAKNDKTIKSVINNMSAYLTSKGIIDSSVNAYEAYSQFISEGLESMSEARSMADNNTVATYSCYTDSKNNVKGRALDVMGERYLYQATTQSGDNFATILDIANKITVDGSGTEKNGVANATYSLSVADYSDPVKLVEVQLIDFSEKDDKLNGSVRVSPTENLLNEMGMGSGGSSILSVMSLALEFKFDSTGENTVMDINLLNGSSVLFGFSTTSKTSEKALGSVELPASSNVISFENAEEWVKTFDLTKLKAALQNTSIPDELLNVLIEGIDSVGTSTATAPIR